MPSRSLLSELTSFHVFVPTVAALLAWGALRSKRLAALSPRTFVALVAAVFLVSRLGVQIVVFHVQRFHGVNDLLVCWEPAARAVLDGRDPWPHLDPFSGPLFPFVLASGYALSGGRYAPGIDAPFVLADAICLVLLLRLARRRFDEGTSRRIVVAAALMPLCLIGTTALSQDESLVACALLAALDLSESERPVAACAAVALGTLATKALLPIWAVPILLAAPPGRLSPVARVAFAAGMTVAGLGVAAALGYEIGARTETTRQAFGASSWFLFIDDPVLPHATFALGIGLTAVVAIAAAVAATRRRGMPTVDRAVRGVVAVQAVFFLVSPYSIPLYLAQSLPFVLWLVALEGGAAIPVAPVGAVLAAGVLAWQIPSIAVGIEAWPLLPAMTAAWTAFWAWVLWRSVAGAAPREPARVAACA